MNKQLTYKKIKRFPKVELHLHLDCSLSYNVVSKINPLISVDQYHLDFIAPEKCKNLADFLRCTHGSINLMQSKKNLELVTYHLFDQLKSDNVVYAEIRFAPLLHSHNGLIPEDVVEIVSHAIAENIQRTGITAGLILCTLRHFSEQDSLKTAQIVKNYIDSSPVCGFDIAADESGFPIDNHIKAFEYAVKNNIPRTAHAGEARGPDSMWETLKHFKPCRIGHGVRSIEDKKLIEYIVENNIHLEICPTCNIQTDIYEKYSDHPINQLFNQGVSLGVNTDARTLTNISLTEEYIKLEDTFNWGISEFKECNINALNASFVDNSKKEELLNNLKAEYQKFLS